jgi:RNA polymerase-binding transcription factor DksA
MARVIEVESATLSPRDRKRLLQIVLKARRSKVNGHATADPLQATRDLEDQLVWLRILEHDEESRGQLEETVRLIRAGRYGLCSACGETIPAPRLSANPIALRCLPCQSEYERTLEGIGVAA